MRVLPFFLIFLASCGSPSVPELGVTGNGFACGTVVYSEDELPTDFPPYSTEELQEKLDCVIQEHYSVCVEWKRAKREALRILTHDKLDYRRQRQDTACFASIVCEYEVRIEQLKCALEKRRRGTP